MRYRRYHCAKQSALTEWFSDIYDTSITSNAGVLEAVTCQAIRPGS